MNTVVVTTPPTSPQEDAPELIRTRSKWTVGSPPSRLRSPRDTPLPISPIPASPYPRELYPSSPSISLRQHPGVLVESHTSPRAGTPRSPPARPPRPPTSLPNIRPTIILSPQLIPSLPPADRPLFLRGKPSFSTASTSPSKPSFSTATSSTWEDQSLSTLAPPSPCVFTSPVTRSCHLSPVSLPHHTSHRRPSLPNPPKSPRKPQRHHSSYVHTNTHRRGHSSTSTFTSANPSSNVSACASMSVSAASSPSSSLLRLASPHPPSPSPYPPPTLPLPAPPPPSPLSQIHPRWTNTHDRRSPTVAVAAERYRARYKDREDKDEMAPLKYQQQQQQYVGEHEHHPAFLLRHHHHHQEKQHLSSHHAEYCHLQFQPYSPHSATHYHNHYHDPDEAAHDHDHDRDDELPGQIPGPQTRTMRCRKYLWMLATAATVAVLVGATLGGVVWRLSRG